MDEDNDEEKGSHDNDDQATLVDIVTEPRFHPLKEWWRVHLKSLSSFVNPQVHVLNWEWDPLDGTCLGLDTKAICESR